MKSTAQGSAYPAVAFADPAPHGYVYACWSVDPPSRLPVVRSSSRRAATIDRLTNIAHQLDAHDLVVEATVFEAVLLPPVSGWPRFDVALLVRTVTPDAIGQVQAAEPYQQLGADLVMTARNARRIGDTDRGSGTFLFNHFTAPDQQDALEAWESLTGWYTAKTGVDNSTVLQPIGDAPYAFVNYVRLPGSAVRFVLSQFSRRSFVTFVRATLRAHGMVAMPTFYRPVTSPV